MFGLLSKSKEDGFENYQWVESFLRWLCLFQETFRISPKITREIEKDIVKWPEELQRKCVEMKIITIITTRYKETPQKTETTEKPAVLEEWAGNPPNGEDVAKGKNEPKNVDPVNRGIGNKQEKEVMPGFREKNQLTTEIKNGTDALRLLKKISVYIEETEGRQKDLAMRLARVKQEFQAEREKHIEAKNKLSVTEKNLYEKERTLKVVEQKLEDAQNKVSEMNDRMVRMEQQYEADKTELLDMIDTTSEQSVEQIKNRLISKLRTDFIDFMQADNEEMTAELGENFRIQLRNIFTILEEEGIKP